MNRSSFLAVLAAPIQSLFPVKTEQAKIEEVRRELELEASRLRQAGGEQEAARTPV